MARHVIIAANPNAGARSVASPVRRLGEALVQRGYVAQIVTDINEVERLSQQRFPAGDLHTVVAAGGDGTLSLVANRTPIGTPISTLPLGTENLFAKYIGMPKDVQAVCDVIQRGSLVQFDAGRVGEKLFLLMFSCGLDADVVRRLHDGRDGHIRHVSYVKPIVQSLRNYTYPELRVRYDDDRAIHARWAFVFNLPCYAFGLGRCLAPDAVATDGRLDLLTFRRGSLSRALLYLGNVLLGKHESLEDCTSVRAGRIRIESDEPVPFELDGDPAGHLPVEISVVPRRLTLLTPPKWNQTSSCGSSVQHAE